MAVGAQQLVRDYLGAQYEAIQSGGATLIAGRDAVHPTRVAVRRIRTVLRELGPVVEAEREAVLDAELKWLAGLLGEVRDRDVLRARLAEAIAELPDEAILDDAAVRVDADVMRERRRHRGALGRALRSARYTALLAELADWLAAEQQPRSRGDLRRAVESIERKTAKRLRKALRAEDDRLLHQARKTAKRARYAAELAAPALGKKRAKQLIAHHKHVQDVLGQHMDAVMSAAFLRRRAQEGGFTYGVLYQYERQRLGALSLS